MKNIVSSARKNKARRVEMKNWWEDKDLNVETALKVAQMRCEERDQITSNCNKLLRIMAENSGIYTICKLGADEMAIKFDTYRDFAAVTGDSANDGMVIRIVSYKTYLDAGGSEDEPRHPDPGFGPNFDLLSQVGLTA